MSYAVRWVIMASHCQIDKHNCFDVIYRYFVACVCVCARVINWYSCQPIINYLLLSPQHNAFFVVWATCYALSVTPACKTLLVSTAAPWIQSQQPNSNSIFAIQVVEWYYFLLLHFWSGKFLGADVRNRYLRSFYLHQHRIVTFFPQFPLIFIVSKYLNSLSLSLYFFSHSFFRSVHCFTLRTS